MRKDNYIIALDANDEFGRVTSECPRCCIHNSAIWRRIGNDVVEALPEIELLRHLALSQMPIRPFFRPSWF